MLRLERCRGAENPVALNLDVSRRRGFVLFASLCRRMEEGS